MSIVRRSVVGGTVLLAVCLRLPLPPEARAQVAELAQAATRAPVALPSHEIRDHYRKAFAAAESGRWDDVRRLTQAGKDPLANKILHWLELQQPRSGAAFEDVAAFIDANAEWPGQDLLIRRAEEALVDRTEDSLVLAWFAGRAPATVDGAMRYAEALFRSGERAKAIQLVRDTWATGVFGEKQEAQFLARYGQHLSLDHHAARIDRLIWEGRHGDARRILGKVDAGRRAVAEARIRLATMSGGVDAAVNRVPAHLQNDPGLVFERARWRRRKGQTDGALELLKTPMRNPGRPEIWWPEREFHIRRLVGAGRMGEAYRLARDHAMTGGASFSEAEFLAGWIALRFLNDGRGALRHFTKLYDAARFPVTQARGAYWAGRAAEAVGDRATARKWFETAARFAVTYYGQRAQARLPAEARPEIPRTPEATANERRAFERSELTRAARLLSELGQDERVKPFVIRHVQLAKTPGKHALAAEFALSLGRPDLAVSAAKRSAQIAGIMLPQQGWPVVPYVRDGRPERALVLATIRQESAFEPQAVSRAGARGLMQLMPATARAVAKEMGMGRDHSDHRLLADPAYNVDIGRSYLRSLIDDYDGSYVLALAAYNAGPGRVRQWIRDSGDPRAPHVDAVDWIELIPFAETRNYVQRVLENVQVYRWILGEDQLAQSMPADLKR